MHISTAKRLIRAALREKFGPRYCQRFEIRTCEANRAISVHWAGEPDEAVIQAIGSPLVTNFDGDGLWFFQTHHSNIGSLSWPVIAALDRHQLNVVP
jgi:hypothetical protein